MNEHQETEDARRIRWEKQIAPCRSGLYALFTRRGFLRQEAEDLTQETLIRAYRYFERIRIPQVACAYVRRVASSIIADYLDKKHKHPEITGLNAWADENERDLFERERLQPVFGDGPQDPQEMLQQQATLADILDALHEVSERDRTIVILCYLENRSHQEIAVLLGMTADAVKVAASRARKRLREKIKLNDAR